MSTLTVLEGGASRAVRGCGHPSWECDELRIGRAVATAERLAAAERSRHLLAGALAALYRPQPDVDAAERLVTAALRLAVQEATRAANDIERDPEPVAARRRAA